MARERAPDAWLSAGSIEALPHAAATFDVVMAHHAIQYAVDPRRSRAAAAGVVEDLLVQAGLTVTTGAEVSCPFASRDLDHAGQPAFSPHSAATCVAPVPQHPRASSSRRSDGAPAAATATPRRPAPRRRAAGARS